MKKSHPAEQARIPSASRHSKNTKTFSIADIERITRKTRTRSNVSREMICSGERLLARAALEKSLGFRLRYSGSQLSLRWCHICLHCKRIEGQWLRGSEVEGNLGKAGLWRVLSQIMHGTVRQRNATEAERLLVSPTLRNASL